MIEVHRFIAQVALVLAALGAAGSVISMGLRRPPGAVIAGGLIWLGIMLVVGGMVGIVIALSIQPPRDPLHVVYGLLAPGALVATAVFAAERPPERRAVPLAIGTVVVLVLVYRLFGTGA